MQLLPNYNYTHTWHGSGLDRGCTLIYCTSWITLGWMGLPGHDTCMHNIVHTYVCMYFKVYMRRCLQELVRKYLNHALTTKPQDIIHGCLYLILFVHTDMHVCVCVSIRVSVCVWRVQMLQLCTRLNQDYSRTTYVIIYLTIYNWTHKLMHCIYTHTLIYNEY